MVEACSRLIDQYYGEFTILSEEEKGGVGQGLNYDKYNDSLIVIIDQTSCDKLNTGDFATITIEDLGTIYNKTGQKLYLLDNLEFFKSHFHSNKLYFSDQDQVNDGLLVHFIKIKSALEMLTEIIVSFKQASIFCNFVTQLCMYRILFVPCHKQKIQRVALHLIHHTLNTSRSVSL